MAQLQEFRIQSTVPTNLPSTSSTVALFANATSGIEAIDYLGRRTWVGGQLSGNLPVRAMRTGAPGVGTGGFGQVVFTSFTGAGIPQTGLGMPSFFIPFVGSDGLQYGVPAYPIGQP